MTLFFRSMSCRLAPTSAVSPPKSSVWQRQDEEQLQEFEPISTPHYRQNDVGQSPILSSVAAVLKKSLLVTCSVETDEFSGADISCPTNVRHISHVTFDRFHGFMGLPLELQPQVPARVPSASASVFGVSPRSLQCSVDERGNSVPTILLMMQKKLYEGGGLQAEGIFRINPENSLEESIRGQLNKGVLPQETDVHCLAGLIKAWFRELPKGVLDSLSPEQVMHCNTEEQCSQLVKLLPPIECALLDWAINLMTDVVRNENHNKMNARNIAMVFAPNMTQMVDPLTALIHAVQVMNFLKTLIVRTLRLREEYSSILHKEHEHPQNNKKLLRSVTLARLEFSPEQTDGRYQNKTDNHEQTPYSSSSGGCSPVSSMASSKRYDAVETERILDRFNLRKRVKKLRRHPVFQLSKPAKKTADQPATVNSVP